MSHQLEYARGNFPRHRSDLPYGLALAGTVLNYIGVLAVSAWAQAVVDHLIVTYGQAALWSDPKIMAIGERALHLPTFGGLAWVLLVTLVGASLMIRQRAHALAVTGFVLVNLFGIILMGALIDTSGRYG